MNNLSDIIEPVRPNLIKSEEPFYKIEQVPQNVLNLTTGPLKKKLSITTSNLSLPSMDFLKRVDTPIHTNTGRWSHEEHVMFLQGYDKYGKCWKKIAALIRTRTLVQIRTHAQKFLQKAQLIGTKRPSPHSFQAPMFFNMHDSPPFIMPAGMQAMTNMTHMQNMQNMQQMQNMHTPSNMMQQHQQNTWDCLEEEDTFNLETLFDDNLSHFVKMEPSNQNTSPAPHHDDYLDSDLDPFRVNTISGDIGMVENLDWLAETLGGNDIELPSELHLPLYQAPGLTLPPNRSQLHPKIEPILYTDPALQKKRRLQPQPKRFFSPPNIAAMPPPPGNTYQDFTNFWPSQPGFSPSSY